jgi:hypothetical protein
VTGVQKALADVMADVRAVGKEGQNKAQGYNFRGIDGVMNAVGPALRKHQVVVLPELRSIQREVIEVGKARTPMQSVTVEVAYYFVGPDGDHLISVVPGQAMDSGDKAVTKAMSVALRTCLIQTLCLPTHEPDPDEDSYQIAAKPTKEKTVDETYTIAEAKQRVLDAVLGDKECAHYAWNKVYQGGDTVPANDVYRMESLAADRRGQ